MGVYIAIGLVVALFVAAAVMWFVRNNETYDELLPPEKQGPEPPREDIIAYAKKRGFEVWESASDALFSDETPNTHLAADAFSFVECQDLRADKIMVSPTTLKMIEAWDDEVIARDPLKLWGAEIHSDDDLADDIMVILPEIPDEVAKEADPIKIGYAIWGVGGAPSSGIDEPRPVVNISDDIIEGMMVSSGSDQ